MAKPEKKLKKTGKSVVEKDTKPKKKKVGLVKTGPLTLQTVQLANEYRPQTLDDVVGQDQVVATLQGAFKRGKFPSALMFSGHYGCGKTTMAFIAARQINCETLNLCGKCFSCQFAKHPDIIYFDAGQSGKIDEIRSLIAAAGNAPATRKRIIIIDEAHTLRDQSEKALLVATENPPPHTIYMLCTTHPDKVNKMLKSRCMPLHVRPIEHDVLIERMTAIAEQEGVTLKKEAKKSLNTIAESSNGSMREAVSKLDIFLSIVASGKKFDPTNIASFMSDADVDMEETAAHFLAAVLQRDMEQAVVQIRSAGNARGLINKTRWLIDYRIGVITKTNKFRPYSGKIFDDLKVKNKMLALVLIQNLLAEIEVKLNSITIDESVLFYSNVGAFIAEYE
jgi:DNA polymerase-3 subunit gamma/tau